MQTDSDEERSAPRRRMLKRVRISFNNESSTVEAVLRNISETGCYIELPDGFLIPDAITIHNELDGYKVDCEVVRRQGNRIGVKFVSDKVQIEAARKEVVNVIDYTTPQERQQPAPQPAAPQPGPSQLAHGTPKLPSRRKAPVFGKLGTPR